MPASFGLECPHLHCTRVHNKRPQTPTSFMCKSTIKDMRVPRRYTRPSLHAPRGACIFLARVQEMPAAATSCARWQDTRTAPLCVHTKMHASPSYTRPRHTRILPLLACTKDGRTNKDACKKCTRRPLLPASQRCARLGSYRSCD